MDPNDPLSTNSEIELTVLFKNSAEYKNRVSTNNTLILKKNDKLVANNYYLYIISHDNNFELEEHPGYIITVINKTKQLNSDNLYLLLLDLDFSNYGTNVHEQAVGLYNTTLNELLIYETYHNDSKKYNYETSTLKIRLVNNRYFGEYISTLQYSAYNIEYEYIPYNNL